MDNPWGEPSPPLSTTSLPPASTTDSSPPPAQPRLSFDPDADDRPTWGTDEAQDTSSALSDPQQPTTMTDGLTDLAPTPDAEILKDDVTTPLEVSENVEEQAIEPEEAALAETETAETTSLPSPGLEEDGAEEEVAADAAPAPKLSKSQKKKAAAKAKKEKEREEAERVEKEKEEENVVAESVVEPEAVEEVEARVQTVAVEKDAVEEVEVEAEVPVEQKEEQELAPTLPDKPASSPPTPRSAPPSPTPAQSTDFDDAPFDDAPFDEPSLPAPTPFISLSLPSPAPNEAPPMDDFDDFDEPSSALAYVAAPAEDDFDDFGDAAEEGADEGDDDFGDFGDFGDSAPLDESAFDAPSLPPPVPIVAPSPAPPPAPVPSAFPPLRLDLTNTARRAIAPQLEEFCRAAWVSAEGSVSDEPERQVEGVAQVLATENSRSLLANLSKLPQLLPLDWRRSKIRREHLISMGIPVNLDDSAQPKYPTLIVPRTRISHNLSPSPTRPSSAPPGQTSYNAFPHSPNSQPGSRSSTPFADRERTRPSNGPPPFDTNRAEEVMAIKEEDLSLLSLQRLQHLNDELDRISVEASGVLTHALMTREKEGQDKEVYNGMIQDLVIAAAKMKTSSALSSSAGKAPKKQGSGRWGL